MKTASQKDEVFVIFSQDWPPGLGCAFPPAPNCCRCSSRALAVPRHTSPSSARPPWLSSSAWPGAGAPQQFHCSVRVRKIAILMKIWFNSRHCIFFCLHFMCRWRWVRLISLVDDLICLTAPIEITTKGCVFHFHHIIAMPQCPTRWVLYYLEPPWRHYDGCGGDQVGWF